MPLRLPSLTLRLRLLLLAALLLGLFLVGRHLGLTSLSPTRLRALLGAAGPLGAVLFLVAFALGELVHVPGVIFVVAAALGYGRLLGGGLSYLGALISISVTFVVIRAVGGQALATMAATRPLLRRALDKLEARPVRSVIILRLCLFLAPQLNTALALSPVRYRDYLVGSAIGLLPAIAAVTLLSELFVR